MCLIELRAFLRRILGPFMSNTQSHPEDTTNEDKAPKCRFPLDDDSSDVLTLPDGRKLGYAQYGLLTGKPIFYLHGLPGARTEAACFEDLAQELGARIIAADRPGMGWSSPHAGRSLLDHPKDLEELAKHLKLEKYGVLVRIIPLYSPVYGPRILTFLTGDIRRRAICTCLCSIPAAREAKSCLYHLWPRASRYRYEGCMLG